MPRFEARSRLPFTPAEVWAWHERPGAFRRLTPPWEGLRIRSCGALAQGERSDFEISLGPLRRRWIARIVECHPGSEFIDAMESGPLRAWTHRHLFLPEGDGCEVRDEIEYEFPCSPALERLGRGWFERRLRRLFLFRHARVREDLARSAESPGAPLRIAVTGATGLVGRRIVDFLAGAGHSVVAIARSSASAGRLAIPGIERTILWDPSTPRASTSELAGFDAVVHLAGESIAGRWTPERRKAIADSRVAGTRRLCEDLLRSGAPPRVFVSASATGWYGDRGEEILDEWSPPGEGFLAEVCAGWENASRPLSDSGTRTAHLRFGIVLAGGGGALAPMARATAWGAGAVLGTGRQWVPWIELGDLVGAVHRVVRDATLSGAINAVSPEPMRQRDFAKVLGAVLGRPVPWRIPAQAIRLGLGEMGEALLLASARVVPTRLQAAGFGFFHPSLEDALCASLGREAP